MAYEVSHEDLLRAKKFKLLATMQIKEEKEKKKLFLSLETLDPEYEASRWRDSIVVLMVMTRFRRIFHAYF